MTTLSQADHGDHLAGLDGQGHVIERLEVAVKGVEMINAEEGHSQSPAGIPMYTSTTFG